MESQLKLKIINGVLAYSYQFKSLGATCRYSMNKAYNAALQMCL